MAVAVAVLGAFHRNRSAKQVLNVAEETEKELLELGKRATLDKLEELEEVGNAAGRAN